MQWRLPNRYLRLLGFAVLVLAILLLAALQVPSPRGQGSLLDWVLEILDVQEEPTFQDAPFTCLSEGSVCDGQVPCCSTMCVDGFCTGAEAASNAEDGTCLYVTDTTIAELDALSDAELLARLTDLRSLLDDPDAIQLDIGAARDALEKQAAGLTCTFCSENADLLDQVSSFLETLTPEQQELWKESVLMSQAGDGIDPSALAAQVQHQDQIACDFRTPTDINGLYSCGQVCRAWTGWECTTPAVGCTPDAPWCVLHRAKGTSTYGGRPPEYYSYVFNCGCLRQNALQGVVQYCGSPQNEPIRLPTRLTIGADCGSVTEGVCRPNPACTGQERCAKVTIGHPPSQQNTSCKCVFDPRNPLQKVPCGDLNPMSYDRGDPRGQTYCSTRGECPGNRTCVSRPTGGPLTNLAECACQ